VGCNDWTLITVNWTLRRTSCNDFKREDNEGHLLKTSVRKTKHIFIFFLPSIQREIHSRYTITHTRTRIHCGNEPTPTPPLPPSCRCHVVTYCSMKHSLSSPLIIISTFLVNSYPISPTHHTVDRNPKPPSMSFPAHARRASSPKRAYIVTW
jgi:hypothetical protein